MNRCLAFAAVVAACCPAVRAVDWEVVGNLAGTSSSLPSAGPDGSLRFQSRTDFSHEAFLFANKEWTPADWLVLRAAAHSSFLTAPSDDAKPWLPDAGVAEMVVGWRPSPSLFLDMGRVQFRNGSGWLTRPTDWFFHDWNAASARGRDLSEQLSDGFDGFRAGWLLPSGALSVVGALPDTGWPWSRTDLEDRSRIAMIASWRRGGFETSVLGMWSQDRSSQRLGWNMSHSFNDNVSIHAEASASRSQLRILPGPDTLLRNWAPRILLGTILTPSDGQSWTLEYVHDRAGIPSGRYDAVLLAGSDAWKSRADASIFATTGAFPDFGLGRHYGFVRYWRQFQDPAFSWDVYEVANLQDASGVVGATISVEAGHFKGSIFTRDFHGRSASEYGLVPSRWTAGVETDVLF